MIRRWLRHIIPILFLTFAVGVVTANKLGDPPKIRSRVLRFKVGKCSPQCGKYCRRKILPPEERWSAKEREKR